MTDIDTEHGLDSEPPEHKGLISYFANNIVAANLTMGLMLVGGLIAALSLTAQVFPSLDPGIIRVSVPYPGATPAEVEEGITRRAEEAVFGIEGVDRVVSVASENMGTLSIELKDFVDAKAVLDDVESAIDQIADFPPGDAEQADIVKVDQNNDVITLVVYSDRSEKYLRQGAEQLEDALLTLPNVSLVSMLGKRNYEISIEVSEDSLRRYNLTMEQVANAVRFSSLNLASGELRTEAGDLLLRTNTKREQGDEFGDVILRAQPDGSFLRLGDVATIRDGFADVDLINEYNGQSAVLLNVSASEAEDILQIAKEIKDLLADYEPMDGIGVDIWSDQSEVLADRLSLLLRNGTLGFALVFLFLVIMLDLRLAVWVAMGVPISFMGAFLFFDFLSVNINMISLFALIIVLGIVVDDAVVVGENIIAEHERGHDGLDAAVLGVRGVISPVMIGVLTTMAAFAPLLFVTGQFGQILGVVPIVVIVVLAMSLIEAFFILPAHLAHGDDWSRWPLDALQRRVSSGLAHFRDNRLIPAIRLALRHRYITLGIGIGFLVFSVSLLGTQAVRFIFFPSLEADFVRADLAYPVGTPFDTTRVGAKTLIDAAYATDQELGGTNFKSVTATIGGQTQVGGGPSGSSNVAVASHISSISIQLNPEPLRTQSASEIERVWRSKVGVLPGVENVSYSAEFFFGGPDVQYELSHQNDEMLDEAIATFKTALGQFEAVYDIQDSFEPGKRQYDVALTPAGEAAGLTPSQVARQLRRYFFGEEVQRIQRGREEIKVMVRYPESERRSTQDLYNARIRLTDGTEAPLRTVAVLNESRGYSTIDRVDGRRIVTVSAEVDTAVQTPTEVNAQIQSQILPNLDRQFPGLQYKQSGIGEQQSEDLSALGKLSQIALLVIFAMIASQLRSYAQPLIIMAAIPFGAGGAIIGHWLLGYNLSFISIFGIIALSGVVVNDSLILIDRYNRFRRETNLNPLDAIIAATQRRFRAIVLTTATTALGLTPMLFETSIQAQFLIPMAVSLATGIVFASVVILFLVPVLVLVREDIRGTTRAEAASSAS